jgi:hypothetical protein
MLNKKLFVKSRISFLAKTKIKGTSRKEKGKGFLSPFSLYIVLFPRQMHLNS